MSFWQRHGDVISAAITVVVALIAARVLDRVLVTHSRRVAERVSGGITAATETRLRLARRLLFATVLLIGIALALSQFDSIKRLAAGVLASTAVLGLVIGFAARQALGNAVAGIMLAITQPIRIGDYVRFQDSAGLVADMTLTFTHIDTFDGGRLLVPNEQLVTAVVHNRSLPGPGTALVVSAWLSPGSDMAAARRALEPLEPESVRLAEIGEERFRLEVSARSTGGSKVAEEESELRERVLTALAQAGLLGDAAPG